MATPRRLDGPGWAPHRVQKSAVAVSQLSGAAAVSASTHYEHLHSPLAEVIIQYNKRI